MPSKWGTNRKYNKLDLYVMNPITLLNIDLKSVWNLKVISCLVPAAV